MLKSEYFCRILLYIYKKKIILMSFLFICIDRAGRTRTSWRRWTPPPSGPSSLPWKTLPFCSVRMIQNSDTSFSIYASLCPCVEINSNCFTGKYRKIFIILPPLPRKHWAAALGCTEIEQFGQVIGVTVHSHCGVESFEYLSQLYAGERWVAVDIKKCNFS